MCSLASARFTVASYYPMANLMIETIELPHGPTPVLWRRSARARRVSLRIDPQAEAVVVTLPKRAARSAGLRLLADHAGWVGTKLAALPPALLFTDGASLSLGGEPVWIRHRPSAVGGAWFAGSEIHVAGDAAFLTRRVCDLLRAEAARRLGALVETVCSEMKLRPARIAIRDTRTRWGSCSPDGTVMFSWRLIMAPKTVQRYVVVHELAHLHHMNHGPNFWRLVEAFAPDRAAATAWLRRHGTELMRAGQAR